MAAHPRVVHKRRATITALPLYYCGQLLKRSSSEKDFKKYYGELRAATLFLYKDDTQDTYTEKLDLEELKSMELDCPYLKKAPTIFTLTLPTEEVQLKMDNPDTGEEWRGYILTVIKKEIPSNLQLLPGQMLLLQELLDQESRRNAPTQRPALPPRPAFLPPAALPPPPLPAKQEPDPEAAEIPACFLNVTRQEAEQMLEAHPEYGGIILRPSTLTNNYALTLRQVTASGSAMKNFRVSPTKKGFVIELDTAVTVPTLNDVLGYFVERTEYRLHPYVVSQPYDTRIDMAAAPKCISIASPALKAVPRAQVAPMQRPQAKEEPLPGPAEGEYLCPDEDHEPRRDLGRKLVQLDGEFRDVLKIRREITDKATEEEEDDITYENHINKKSHTSKA